MSIQSWSKKNIHMPNTVWEKLDKILDKLNKKNTGRKLGRGIAIEHLIGHYIANNTNEKSTQ